jgi:uncharacterized protein (TIGR03083 family)
MSNMEERISLARTESERLGQYFQTLTAEQWSTQSACDAWENHDVVAHLCMAVDMFVVNVGRGVAGDSSPPEGAPAPSLEALAARMADNAQRAVATRESLADGLLPHFAAQCQRFDEQLRGLSPEDWGKPCYHPAMVIPVSGFVDLRITEMAVHEWDIRSRIEPVAHLPAQVLPPVFDLLPAFVVGRFYRPGSGIASPTTFRFNLTGPFNRSYDMTVGGGEVQMAPAASDTAAVTLGCDAETFALVAYGRLGLAEMITAGRVSAAGDPALVAAFNN